MISSWKKTSGKEEQRFTITSFGPQLSWCVLAGTTTLWKAERRLCGEKWECLFFLFRSHRLISVYGSYLHTRSREESRTSLRGFSWTSTLNQFVKMFSISPEQKGTRCCSRARDHFSLSFMVSLLLWSSSRFCFSPNGNAQPVRPLTPSCFPKSPQKWMKRKSFMRRGINYCGGKEKPPFLAVQSRANRW